MNNANKMSEFVVFKKSYEFKTCFKCEGTGQESTPLRKLTFVKDCPECSGTGRKRFTITEEVPLTEALEEVQKVNVKIAFDTSSISKQIERIKEQIK